MAAGELPPLFQVSTLVARGATAAEAATNAGEYEDYRFLFARQVLARIEAINPNHPLLAHIAERYAWSLIDQWKVDEAGKQFQAAYHIRLTDKEEKNPFAPIYLFHNRHGSAMAARYRGNLYGRGEPTRRLSTKSEQPWLRPNTSTASSDSRTISALSKNAWPIPWNAGPIASSIAGPLPMEGSTYPRPLNPTTRPGRSRPNGAIPW